MSSYDAAHCPTWQDLDEAGRKEFWAGLALRHCRGLGPRTGAALLRRFGSAYAALQHLDQWRAAGMDSPLAANMASGSWRVTARQEWDAVRRLPCGILLWNDPLFPDCLKTLPDAPVLLYCQGDVSLLRAPALAVVGARKASPEGCRVAAHMARCLASCGLVIVSGMAQGVDASAHAAALDEIGRSIGVLGTGIDRAYPRRNAALYDRMRRQGLLLSEFAPGTPPLPEHFPIRNRIISGLSLGILVVEAATRSGSLITARTALEQNREVYAVPGPALDDHCCGAQELIRQGARPVFSAEDILRDLLERLRPYGIDHPVLDEAGMLAAQTRRTEDAPATLERGKPDADGAARPALAPRQPARTGAPSRAAGDVASSPSTNAAAVASSRAQLSGEAEAVVHLLLEAPQHVDDLAAALRLSPAALAPLLLKLEIDGHIRRLPGARYEVPA